MLGTGKIPHWEKSAWENSYNRGIQSSYQTVEGSFSSLCFRSKNSILKQVFNQHKKGENFKVSSSNER